MDIHMRNVSGFFSASDVDIKIGLAKILHKHPYPTTRFLNFNVDLWQGKLRGQGILTIPNAKYGERFLEGYASKGLVVKGGRIKFSRGHRPPSEAKVNMLKDTSWQDPLETRRERDRIARDSSELKVQAFSFGKFCRDGSFSEEVVPGGAAVIACDRSRKELRLSIATGAHEHDDDLGLSDFTASLFGDQKLLVSYKLSGVESLVIDSDASNYCVFIRARAPPSISRHRSAGLFGSTPQSQRLSSLIHGADMPPGCHSLRVTFSNQSDFTAFTLRCKRLTVRQDYKSSITIHENTWSAAAQNDLDRFLAPIWFPLAWEVAKAVSSSVLSTREVMSIQQDITALEREDRENASRIFQRFTFFIEEFAERRTTNRLVRLRRRQRKDIQISTSDPSSLSRALRSARKTVQMELATPFGPLSALPPVNSYDAYHLIFTPTTQILEGPLPDQSNSVLRRFGHHECFLRVSFQDENCAPLRRDFEWSISELMKSRFRPKFLKGHRVAGRKFEFLGYSMSGLREHSVWFVAPFQNDRGEWLNAAAIRNLLGDFSELLKRPARLGARWSQAFSTTDPSVVLRQEEIFRVDDIISPRSKKVMTDGCSSISPDLARNIWEKLRTDRRQLSSLKNPPSAFQFRLGGAKGVVVQNPDLEGKVVCLRPSQLKFEGSELTFDVQSHSRSRPMYLNRPLIALLEHVAASGLVTRVLKLQHDDIMEAQGVRSSFKDASKMLEVHGLGAPFRLGSLFHNLSSELNLHVWTSETPRGLRNEIIIDAMRCISTHALRELKYRAHIRVPGSYTLMGVSDEWDCLNPGEIFATVRDYRTGVYHAIEGPVAVTRSPQIHPGDIQVVKAVRRPELEHLTNVIVFSTRGDRPLPNYLGGGDLDGDDFNLILDENLFPTYNRIPGSYVSLPIKETPHICGVEDVVDFIFDYFESDLVGLISIAHLRFADLGDPDSQECMTLAELASQAVDFPKTGTPVQFEDLPRFPDTIKPDFLAKEGEDPHQNSRFYKSPKLLGRLFRRIPLDDWMPEAGKSRSPFDITSILTAFDRIPLEDYGLPPLGRPREDTLQEMQWLLEAYCDELQIIAQAHTVSRNQEDFISEAELVSGTILANWSDHRKRREAVNAMNLQTQNLTSRLRLALRPRRDETDTEDGESSTYYWSSCEIEEEDSSFMAAEAFIRAWAAVWVAEVSLQETSGKAFGSQSFGLIALGRMLDIAKRERQNL